MGDLIVIHVELYFAVNLYDYKNCAKCPRSIAYTLNFDILDYGTSPNKIHYA